MSGGDVLKRVTVWETSLVKATQLEVSRSLNSFVDKIVSELQARQVRPSSGRIQLLLRQVSMPTVGNKPMTES